MDYLLGKIKEMIKTRLAFMSLAVIVLFSILAVRMYQLQILKADADESVTGASQSSTYKTERLRYNDSTRGNIYDSSGNLLAYNVQSFNIVMGNSALITSNTDKNNMICKLISILENNGYAIETNFPIYIDENGEYAFEVADNALLRFKKNAYGLPSVSKLTQEQIDADAAEVYEFMKNGNAFSPMFGISDDYDKETALKIMNIRYQLFTLYPQYSQFTVCSDVDTKTIAAIKENSDELLGVEIKQVTSRVYNDSLYFAHILGYTGTVNEDEADKLNQNLESAVYNTSDVIGKTGVEKEMDSVLRGTKGVEKLTVNSMGKVVSSKVVSEPIAGNDIYLTVDRELQIACYHILENNIAAILRSKIVNRMDYGGKGTQANKITIPVYEVYNAFINNEIVNVNILDREDASENEREIGRIFREKKASVMDKLSDIISYDSTKIGSSLSDENKSYTDHVYSILKSSGVLYKEKIDEKDKKYIAYTEGSISLSDFLKYAIDMQWVDLSKIGIGSDYFTNRETFDKLTAYAFNYLWNDRSFDKMIYKVLIFDYKISGRQICLLLYDQGVLEYNSNDYSRVSSGKISAYNFIMDKLSSLDITPAMLALEPCSGSIVITDVNTGAVRAMVTYPSYDNNMLANKIDWDYYQSLLANNSLPLLNRPTQQLTATGSTFKPLMALAGMGEGIITPKTRIEDKGIFEGDELNEIVPSPKCWKYPGNHGSITLTQAIQHSCNFFFFEVGFRMALNQQGIYSDSLGISTIQKYAAMFGLAAKSGVEVTESMPAISSTDAVRTSIGYYHSFAPIQISRYITSVANRGHVYNLTLVDKFTDKEQIFVENKEPSVYNNISLYTDEQWNAVQEGMYKVVNTSANDLDALYGDLGGIYVAGKTGTAQVSLTHPSHALFVSFAPYGNPEISVTVVIPNGYSSANAAKLAREVYGLYFNDENKEALLSGDLTVTTVTDIVVSD